MTSERRRRPALASVAAVAALSLPSCGGPDRSAMSWCNAYWDRAIPIHDGYQRHADAARGNPLPVLGDLLSAPRDAAVVLDGMARVAPEGIRADTEALRDSLKALADSEGKAFSDPLGALGDSLGSALSTMGSSRRVDDYFRAHCGTPAEARAARR